MYKFIIGALLILSVVAVQETELKQGVFLDLEEVLQHSNLGKAILLMSQMKAHLQGFDFGQLFVALDELTESFKVRITEENTLFAQDNQNYVADQNFYANQVTQYTNEVAEHQQEIDALNDEREDLESMLQVKQEELYETQKLTDALQRTMANNEVVFQAQSNDYNNAIQVIDQAIQLLEEARDSDASLIQTEQANHMSQTLGASLIALQSHRRVFFQPLIKSLASLTQSNFADQQLLKKVLGLLNDLRASLVQNKQILVNNYENEVKSNNQIMEEYESKAESLAEELIPSIHDSLETVNGELVTKTAILGDSKSNLKIAEDNVEATEKNWISRTLLNKELIQEYNNELQTIAQATTTLERGGVRRE